MQGDRAPQSEGEKQAAAAATQLDPAEAEAVARVLARYREQHPVPEEQLEEVARTVQQALGELRGPAEGEAPQAPAPPTPAAAPRDEGLTLNRWRRAVMAVIAAALLVLFWHRLFWIG